MNVVHDRRDCQAVCDNCLFGRLVTVVEKDKSGKELNRLDMCECHVSRPTVRGFPVVRRDDFCALHVDRGTLARTYAEIVPSTLS